MRAIGLALLLAACGSGSPPPPATPPPAGSAAPIAAVAGVYARACETQCADAMAQLVTYRDAKGAIAVVTVMGSPSGCSHPPLRFLDASGVERAAIPFQPVVPGSDEAKHFDEIRTTQLAGLTKAETMYCRDVKH